MWVVHQSFAWTGNDPVMTLSEDEQNNVNQIETSLLAEDPVFANHLGVVAAQRLLHQLGSR